VTKDRQALGLYFSASWCGPCHHFTPILAGCYQELKAADEAAKRPQRFEVIFLSSDRDNGSFNKYFAGMPWHALNFEQGELKEQLEERYKVEGIPTLVIIDPKTGESINEDTVQLVAADPKGENFPWAPKSVELLDQTTAGSIGPNPVVFVFCGSDEAAKEMQKNLMPAVDVWRGKAQEGAVCHGDVCVPTGGKLEGAEDLQFFVCGAHPIVDRVKELAKATFGVAVVVLDMPKQSYAHSELVSPDKVTPLSLRKFLQSYLQGSVATHQMKG